MKYLLGILAIVACLFVANVSYSSNENTKAEVSIGCMTDQEVIDDLEANFGYTNVSVLYWVDRATVYCSSDEESFMHVHIDCYCISYTWGYEGCVAGVK